jgi:hypothetical protein
MLSLNMKRWNQMIKNMNVRHKDFVWKTVSRGRNGWKSVEVVRRHVCHLDLMNHITTDDQYRTIKNPTPFMNKILKEEIYGYKK